MTSNNIELPFELATPISSVINFIGGELFTGFIQGDCGVIVMKNIAKSLLFIVMLLVLSLPAFTQSRPGSSGDRGTSSGGTIGSAPSVSAPSASVGTGSRSISSSRDGGYSGAGYIAGGGSGGRGSAYAPVPKLQGTSFNSINTYYAWNDFYWYLRNQYLLNSLYFGRFYRNVEPLLTPQLLRLTTRAPLRLSMQMMTAVDELEAMLQARQAGKPVNSQDISAKAQEIRELAKKIRQDQALTFIDQRKDKDILKGNNIENLGLEAISRLREMVTDLNTQLKSMYTQNSTSTVSVNSLTQPSFESLSKGIEKLSKAIENSAKKI